MFDGKHGIALHAMQGNQAASRIVGVVSYIFEVQWKPGVHSRVTMGMAIQNSYLFSDVRTPV